MKTGVRGIIAVFACALLAACGGGGGGGSSSGGGGGIPPAPVPTGTPLPATSIARLTISEPITSTSSAKRRPYHLPRSAQTITVSVNGSAVTVFAFSYTGPTCTTTAIALTCTYDAPVPTGNDTIAVQALNSTGKVLATATTQQTIAGTTVVPVSLAGLPASASVKLSQASAPAGTPTSVPIAVTAFDVDGNLITGAYATPVSLVNSDSSGHSSISPNSIPNSTTSVSLVLDGKVMNARISTGLNTGGDLFATGVAAHEYNVPSATNTSANAGTGTIVLGGDGAMWFGEQNGIGRSDANGNIAEYAMVQPQQLVAGPDGAVWFTTYYDNSTGVSGELCRVAPDGTVTKRNLKLQGTRIALGSDNNFWIAENGASITRVTPAGTVTRFPLSAPGGSSARATDVIAGADGNLWVSDAALNVLYVVSTGGTQTRTVTIAPQPQNGGPVRSAFATDGSFWFTLQLSVVRVMPSSGAATEFNQFPGTLTYFSGTGPGSPILGASDGNIWVTGSWFAGGSLPSMFRVAPNGAILALPLPASTNPALGPTPATGLANGPGGTIWYVRGKSVGWFNPPS